MTANVVQNGRRLRYIGLFSGMEAPSIAIERMALGWEPVAFAEIDPAACALLADRWPHVPNLSDISKVDFRRFAGRVDVVLGGPPCQDFSLAGNRAGMAGGKGNLTMEWVRAISEIKPRWAVAENVVGILSSRGGRDWHRFLHEVGKHGYGLTWRVLDAQNGGLAQHRERVYSVLARHNIGGGESSSRALGIWPGSERDQIPGRASYWEAAAGEVSEGAGQHDPDEFLERWKRPARRGRLAPVYEAYTANFRNGTLHEGATGTIQTKVNSLNATPCAIQDIAASELIDDGLWDVRLIPTRQNKDSRGDSHRGAFVIRSVDGIGWSVNFGSAVECDAGRVLGG